MLTVRNGPLSQEGYVFDFGGLFVSRITEKNRRRILIKCFGMVECVTSNKQLHFGGDPDHDADTGSLKGFFSLRERNNTNFAHNPRSRWRSLMNFF